MGAAAGRFGGEVRRGQGAAYCLRAGQRRSWAGLQRRLERGVTMNPLRAFDGFKSQASQRVVDAWFVASLFGFALAAASYYVGVGIVHFDGRLLNGNTG